MRERERATAATTITLVCVIPIATAITTTPATQAMAEKTLQDVFRKIEREKVLINGARQMRQSTNNQAVQQRLDNQIRESQRNLGYLEEKYKELQNRVMIQNTKGMGDLNTSGNSSFHFFFFYFSSRG